MSAPVWSKRFCVSPAAAGMVIYTVPAGRVAVARFVGFYSSTGPTAQAAAYLNGIPFWFWSPQAPNTSRAEDIRAVAYAGETLQIWSSDAGTLGILTGFEFTGALAARGVDQEFIEDAPMPPPEWHSSAPREIVRPTERP